MTLGTDGYAVPAKPSPPQRHPATHPPTRRRPRGGGARRGDHGHRRRLRRPVRQKPRHLRLALSRRDAAGKVQRLAVAHAEATAADRRYKDGEEVLGIASGWKLPALEEGRTIAGVWLLEEAQ